MITVELTWLCSCSVIDGVGEAPRELVAAVDMVIDGLLLDSRVFIDLFSVVTGLGEGGSGDKDDEEEDCARYTGVGDLGRYGGGGVSKNPMEEIEALREEDNDLENLLRAWWCLNKVFK